MDMPYNETDKRNENWLNAVFDDLNSTPSTHSKVNFMRMILHKITTKTKIKYISSYTRCI